MENFNIIYLIREREFIKTGESIYKLGKCSSLSNGMKRCPKGSQIICVIPVKGNPESLYLQKFREKFIPRLDIGYKYFEGSEKQMAELMFKIKMEEISQFESKLKKIITLSENI